MADGPAERGGRQRLGTDGVGRGLGLHRGLLEAGVAGWLGCPDSVSKNFTLVGQLMGYSGTRRNYLADHITLWELSMTTAFDPIDLAGTQLANRIAMAPMTRSRAYGDGLTVTDSTVEYYSQRASAGLIVTEGIQPSVVGQGYPDTPGLHSAEQVAAWRKVTDAVHAKGGRIFAQIMHAGRIGHPVLLAGPGTGQRRRRPPSPPPGSSTRTRAPRTSSPRAS